MKISKLYSGLAGALALFSMGGPQAGLIVDYDLFDGVGNQITDDAASFDFNDLSAGAALGLGPFGAPISVGETFDFVYQSFVDTFSGGTPSTPTDLVTNASGGTLSGDEIQVTVVARVGEVVTGITALNATTGVSGSVADVLSDASTSIGDSVFIIAIFDQTGTGSLSLFYDDAAKGGTIAERVGGTGYDDGTEIANFSPIAGAGSSSFRIDVEVISDGGGGLTLSAPDQGAGDFTDFQYDIRLGSNFVDANFLTAFDGTALDDAHITGTLNRNEISGQESPEFTPDCFFCGGADGNYIDQTVNTTDDVIFNVDGRQQVSQTIPEPSTLLLLSMGLLGMGVINRRRRQKSA